MNSMVHKWCGSGSSWPGRESNGPPIFSKINGFSDISMLCWTIFRLSLLVKVLHFIRKSLNLAVWFMNDMGYCAVLNSELKL